MQCLCTRCLKEFSWQDLCRCSLQELSWQDLCKEPLGKISTNLYAMSPCKISVQAPYKRSLGKACCRDRCAISFWELSWQDLRKRPLGKISVLYKISMGVSVQDLSVARSLRKLPRKGRLAKISGRDLTRPKCWEGCASNLKIRTAPQQERSERRKWREGCARGLRATVSCRTCVKNGRWGSFCAVMVTKFAERPGYHLEWAPGLNTYRKNPPVWPHCLGKNTAQVGSFRGWLAVYWTRVGFVQGVGVLRLALLLWIRIVLPFL